MSRVIFFPFILVVLALLAWTSTCSAHGLTMTTASVVIRNQTHLTLRLQYDPLPLLEQISLRMDQPPFHLAELANLSDELFEKQCQDIQSLISTKLSIQFEGKPILSLRLRFPTTQSFRKKIRGQFMQGVIDARSAKQQEHRDDHDDDRQYYQIIDIDGFLPEGMKAGALKINFPRELGQVMVTYSEPKTQIITPNQNGSHYQHVIIDNNN